MLHNKQVPVDTIQETAMTNSNLAYNQALYQQVLQNYANVKNLYHNEMQRRIAAERKESQVERQLQLANAQLQQMTAERVRTSKDQQSSRGGCCIIM